MGRKHRAAKGKQLFEKGLLALICGCGLLAAPLLLKSSPILVAVGQGLRTPGWVAIGLGVTLLIVDRIIRRTKARAIQPREHQQPHVLPGSMDAVARGKSAPPGQPRSHADGATSNPLGASGPRRASWDKQVFSEIEWRRFEALCERLFAQAGFQASSQSHGADGGVDIWLYSKNSEGPAAVVQCKHWTGKPVGVKELREFFGVMVSKSLKRGTFATSSTFTSAAVEFARTNGINVLDGDGLLALIARRSAEQQQELLAVAYEGEYWRPTCASCGIKMAERVAAKDGTRFWGCMNFPRCRTTMRARSGGAP